MISYDYQGVIDEMFPAGSEGRKQAALEEPPDAEGNVLWRRLPDGSHIGVTPQLFSAAILTVSEPGQTRVYRDEWMFDAAHGGMTRAISQALLWEPSPQQPEPDGWVRTTYGVQSAGKRYRRRTDATAASEYEAD